MASRDTMAAEITPELLLRAYACGIFPMSESADDPTLFWCDPPERGIFPLGGLIVSSRLARTVRSDRYRVTVDRCLTDIIDGCAESKPGRDNTWINQRIRTLYTDLARIGHCHSIEVWDGEQLAGGLYGVTLGAAFFGESMFHRARDASKVALVHLVARLIDGGFTLLDTQYVTEHLRSLGAIEISRRRYLGELDRALVRDADFARLPLDGSVSGADVLAVLSAKSA